MAPTSKITDEDLQDYLDGRLTGVRLQQVVVYLRSHPMKANELRAMRRQDKMLRLLGKDVLGEPIPERLSAVLGPAAPGKKRD